MGVAGLYKWIVQRYPLIRHRISDLSHPRMNHFYVDFNCIIYNSLQVVNASAEGSNEMLLNEVCRYLDLLVQIIKPTTTLFIAVDGPAPFAKCAQQRQRRFVAAKNHIDGTFSTANISVGTEFMEQLHQHLLDFLSKRIEEDPIWNFPKVIYSSYKCPGEGEHKFFDYFRKQKADGLIQPKETFCIFSPDADLFFLTLQTGHPYFYIMREWMSYLGPNEDVGNGKLDKMRYCSADFELIHLPLLIDYFKIQYQIRDNEIHRMITDFVALSFILGNDFIPHFPEIDIHTGDFEAILSAYQTSIRDRHTYLINEDITFNKENLKNFLRAIVAKAQKHIEDKPKKFFFKYYSQEGARQYLKAKYSDRYDSDGNLERELCHAVIDSLNFCLNYYFKGCPSWTWAFPEPYIPPLVLVIDYIDGYDSKFELDRPPLPLEQLLSVLPPKMASLLPQPLSSLMFNPSPLEKFYPPKFDIDLNNKKYEHEGVILIPNVDIFLLRKEVEKVLPLLSPEEQKRNTIEEITIIKDKANQIDPKLIQKDPPLPSLFSLDLKLECSLDTIGVNVFPHSKKGSFSPSLLLTPDFSKFLAKTANEYLGLIGKLILVDWPFLRPAIVTSIFDDKKIISKGDDGNIVSSKVKDEKTIMIRNYRKKYALDISECKIGIIASPYAVKSFDDSIIRSSSNLFFPLAFCSQTMTPKVMLRYQNIIKYPSPKPGDEVALLTEGYKGHKAIIQEINDKTAKVQLIDINLLDTSFINNDNYTLSLEDISDETMIPTNVLDKVLSSIPSGKESDLGLPFHYENQFILDGYTKFIKGRPMFNKEVLTILNEYLRFSELQSTFAKSVPNEKGRVIINQKEIGGKDPKERIKEISNWVKNQDKLRNAFLISRNQNMISTLNTTKLQIKLQKHNYTENQGNVIEVPVNEIFYKGHTTLPNRCEPGTRVIFVAPNGPVPFGTTGTVIGFDYEFFILFVAADKPFKLGSSMRKRFTEQFGFACPSTDVLPYE